MRTFAFHGISLLIIFVSVLLLSNFSYGQAGPTLTVNVTVSPNPAWWNDTIKVSGFAVWSDGTAFTASNGTIFINMTQRSLTDPNPGNVTVCNTTTSSSGSYACNFTAPLELGTFNIFVFGLDNQSASLDSETVLFEVKPIYGVSPTGATPRTVFEKPMLIQEPSGRVRAVIVRIITSRGGAIF